MSESVLSKYNNFSEAPDDAFFTTKQVSEFIHMSKAWFDVCACKGNGIPFYKISRKRFYKKADIMEWLEKHHFNKSSEYFEKKKQGVI